MSIVLNGTTGITTPDIQSAAGLDAADLTGTVASARLPAGSVLQVVQFQDNTHRSWLGTGRSSLFVVPGPFGDGSMSITRVSNTSKIFVDVRLMAGCDNDSWISFVLQYAPQGSNYVNFPNIGVTTGNITATGNLAHFGAASGGSSQSDTQYRLHPCVYQYLLDPNTSQNTVFIRLQTSNGHNTVQRTLYLHRPSNVNDNNRYTASSVITLTEIGV